ncbi:MAG: Si-specific NAD(P)(+) transhydrogenase [Elusimicrobia bacterium]|nr:Si-specific NAD(P)(+) transhydrogenase [Elusimicrobiota bacterium]
MGERPEHFDVIVFGSGPGGEGAAMKAAKFGKSVAVVERDLEVGGSCTHTSTIPSKALRHAIQQLSELRNHPLFEELGARATVDYPRLLKAAGTVISRQVKLRRSFYERNGVSVLHGKGRFLDKKKIAVTDRDGRVAEATADHFVLAVGSRPYHPPDVDFSHPRIVDSDKVLDLDRTPRSITIYGAGVVGCEYASILRNLDVKVNLVNPGEKLLSFLDDEIIDALSYHLRDQGVLLRHNEEYSKVEAAEDNVVLHLKSGKKLITDVLLWANGRTGNTDTLGLELLGIKPDKRGNIPVDENYRTTAPYVYAVGDVVGFPSLASAAYDQGRFAATHMLEGKSDYKLNLIPTGIYTSPEISSVGRTEAELTQAKVPYEVGHALFRSIARAQIQGRTVGMLKLLFHRDTLEILGVHCFGDQAAEIVHIGQAVMSQEGAANSLLYFINTTFNYPTMAEAYRVAALNGYNRLLGVGTQI